MAAERREMMCTGKCHKITEHVYLVVIDEYAELEYRQSGSRQVYEA